MIWLLNGHLTLMHSEEKNMNQLKLYRYTEEYINLCRDHGYSAFIKDKASKIWVCLGEFRHAPGHVMMVEFGTWEPMPGMPEIDNFEELDCHPDDFSIRFPIDDYEDTDE